MNKTEYYQAQAGFCVEMAGAIKRPDYREWWLIPILIKSDRRLPNRGRQWT